MVIQNNVVVNDDLDFGEDSDSGNRGDTHTERSDQKTSSG
jgi:hypothetical protein